MNLLRIWNDYRTNRLIAIFWFVTITFLTLSPNISTPSLFSWQDKLGHMIMFSVLGLFICRSFNPQSKYTPINRVFITAFIITIYGILDETTQAIIPGRNASILDLLADILGAFLGGVSFLFVPFLKNTK